LEGPWGKTDDAKLGVIFRWFLKRCIGAIYLKKEFVRDGTADEEVKEEFGCEWHKNKRVCEGFFCVNSDRDCLRAHGAKSPGDDRGSLLWIAN